MNRRSYKNELNPFYGKKHSYTSIEKNRLWHLGKTPWNKGKKMSEKARYNMSKSRKGRTWKEIYGSSYNNRLLKQKISLSKVIKTPEWNYKNSVGQKGKLISEISKNKMRVSRQNYLLSVGGIPQLGKHEKLWLDNLQPIFGYKILRQYPIKGYYLDGYIPERKLAIEIDESHHKPEIDIKRQLKIQNELNCSFLRIKDV